jgi:uncharacterized protein YndB with AHSA1/START domain
MATLSNSGDRPVLRFERRLAHPADRVWTALTDPAELAHWFPAMIEGERAVGATIHFRFEGVDLADAGEILEFEPPRLFMYRWGDSTLRWELVPDGTGCRLVFTHTLGGEPPLGDVRSAARHAAGWDVCLEALAVRLDGRPDGSAADAWFERYEPYMAAFGLDTGEVRETVDGFTVRFERDLVASTGDAWAVLVDGADLAVGGTVPAGATAVPAGPVTALDPPRLLAFEWRHEGAPAGEVRWEIDGPEMFARLVLTQTVPAHLAELRPALLAAWHVQVELFVASLHGVKRAWPDERVAELRRAYESNSQ